jgi:hypothetical protein
MTLRLKELLMKIGAEPINKLAGGTLSVVEEGSALCALRTTEGFL